MYVVSEFETLEAQLYYTIALHMHPVRDVCGFHSGCASGCRVEDLEHLRVNGLRATLLCKPQKCLYSYG